MAPEIALQSAIIDLLAADAAVKAIVGANILDQVPADRLPATPPYIEIGPINRTRFEGCAGAWLIRVRIYATSTDFGRVQAWDLADAIATLLDDRDDEGLPKPSLGLPAPYRIVDALRVVQAGDIVDPLQIKSVFVDVQAVVSRSN